MIIDWGDFAMSAVGGAIAFLCLFDGTRRIGIHGIDGKTGLMAGSAVALYVVFGSFAFWNYLTLTDSLSMRQQRSAQALRAPVLPKGLSPEQIESRNISRARNAFWESGRLEPYLDRLDEKKVFQPNQADIERRELLVANQAKLEYAARASLVESLLWVVTGLLAVLFGFAFSREKAPVPGTGGRPSGPLPPA